MQVIKFIIPLIFGILFISNSYALDCNRTISAALTSQLDCENSDSLTVNSGVVLNFNNNDAVNASNTDEVTIVNSGTIEHSVDEKQSVINGSATRNLTITNNGIINSTKKYGV